jgi:hypothetical protein
MICHSIIANANVKRVWTLNDVDRMAKAPAVTRAGRHHQSVMLENQRSPEWFLFCGEMYNVWKSPRIVLMAEFDAF